jgi:hypothetical protein
MKQYQTSSIDKKSPSQTEISDVSRQHHGQEHSPVKPMARKSPQRATVTKRTRTYLVEGVEVSSTTLHVLEAKQDYELRFINLLHVCNPHSLIVDSAVVLLLFHRPFLGKKRCVN